MGFVEDIYDGRIFEEDVETMLYHGVQIVITSRWMWVFNILKREFGFFIVRIEMARRTRPPDNAPKDNRISDEELRHSFI